MNEWIAVDDRLPEKFDEYLVSDGRYVDIATFLADERKWFGMFRIPPDSVTHWMPLPDAPKV